MIAKMDISRAFHNLRVDPRDAMKLGIKWKDAYYVDGAATFGWLHGTNAFELCSSAVMAFLASHGITMLH